jgi:hypothetical protein
MVRCLGHVTFDFSMPTVRFRYRAVTRELPHNYPFIVQRGYIIDSVGQWDGPAKTLFDFTVEKLKEMTLRVVDTHFAPYGHGGLKRRVS